MYEKSELPIVSYSKVSCYHSCPKKFKFAYIDNIPTQEKPYTIFGNFCHKVLEVFERMFIDGCLLSPNLAMQEAFNLTLKAPSRDPKRNHSKEQIDIFSKKLTKEQKDEAYQIMKFYLSVIKDRQYKVIAVEQKVWLPINNEIALYGYIDRIQKDADGILHIGDYKTTKDPKFLKDRTQLLLYAYAISEKEKVDSVKTSFILLKHKMKAMTETSDKDQLIKARDKFLSDYRDITKDKLFRANANILNCNICDYVSRCSEGSKVMQQRKGFRGETSW